MVNLKANIKSAILQNDIHWVRQLITEGADINAKYTRNGTTLLISAAATGHIEIVKILVNSGAVINQKTTDNYTAIMAACEWDHPDVADFLIDNGADINISTINSEKTTSFSASLEEAIDLEYEDNIETYDNQEQISSTASSGLPGLSSKLPGEQRISLSSTTPSHIIPINTAEDKQSLLNETEPHGYTCLIYTCANKNISLINKLIKMGADINASTSDNESPLSMACSNNYNETILMLIEEGANPNTIISEDGQNILMWASENGLVRLAKLLLDRGASINQKDKFHKTALYEAAKSGHNLIVRVLLEKGAEINIVNIYGETPLMLAAREGHVSIVEELLAVGADTTIKTKKGQTALLMAATENKIGVVEKIIAFKKKLDNLDEKLSECLLDVIKKGHAIIVKKLLEEGANPCYHNEKGVTALMEAAYNRENDIVVLLLKKGADPNNRDDEGTTALIKAAYEWPTQLQVPDLHGHVGDVMVSGGHTSEVKLEEAEVPPNPKDTEHCSITLKILLDAGANPNIYNNKDVSPLSLRIKAHDEKGIRTLIASGVDSTKCTRDGRLKTSELQILDSEFPGIAGLLKKQESQGAGLIKDYDESGF